MIMACIGLLPQSLNIALKKSLNGDGGFALFKPKKHGHRLFKQHIYT